MDFSLQNTQLWLFASLQSKFYAWLWQPLGVITGNQQQNRPRCRWMRINHPVSCVATLHDLQEPKRHFSIEIPYVGVESTMCVGTPKQLLLYIYLYNYVYIYTYITYSIYIYIPHDPTISIPLYLHENPRKSPSMICKILRLPGS